MKNIIYLSCILFLISQLGESVITGESQYVTDCGKVQGCTLDSCRSLLSNAYQGPPGKTGQKGDTGLRGMPGISGSFSGGLNSPGPRGAKGSTGDKGERGITGQRGQIGSKGDKGDIGQRGPKGEAGWNIASVYKEIRTLINEATEKFEKMEARLNEKIDRLEGKQGSFGRSSSKPAPLEVTSCPAPPTSEIDDVVCSDEFKVQSSCFRTCKFGYSLPPGENYMFCMPDGRWSDDLPSCSEVYVFRGISAQEKPRPRSCQDAAKSGGSRGVYSIHPYGNRKEEKVYCDLEMDGGGWTVFQRRIDGSENFNRNWTDYVAGFGKLEVEFWMGLEKIHQMTKDGEYELRIDLLDWRGQTAYAKYGTFAVAGASDDYRLTVGDYTGHQGDSLSYHNGQKFSAPDRDNDGYNHGHCGKMYSSGWWFKSCMGSNLNGKYYQGGEYTAKDYDGISWYHWHKIIFYSLKFTEMKFREKRN